jgi:putative hydrolase of the HAD superfamily
MSDLRAVLWDLGGVIFSSPFEAFAVYELEVGLPVGTIRQLNARNPDTNAWSKLERNQLGFDQFAELFQTEALEVGVQIDGHQVLHLLKGEVRPEMTSALRRCKEHFKVAALTNNIASTGDRGADHAQVMRLFDVVVESSKVGFRKPEPRFYLEACRLLEVEPHQCVFLDDLGVNLKPAAAMGMRTIKVIDPADALRELSEITGLDLG